MLAVVLLAVLSPDPPRGCAWVRAENDGAGAGFVIDADRRLLVTCRHVVAERKKVDVFFPWFRDGALVTERAEYLGNRPLLRDRGLLVVGTVLKTADEFDLALVQLESLPPNTPALTLSPRAPNAGEHLRVVGHRLDLDTLWNVTVGPARASGSLADGYFWRGKKLAAGANVVIGQLPTEEGDSGGPVVDSRGEVVGMASALRRQCPFAAVAVSAAEIRRFARLPNPPAREPEPNAADALIRATVWVKPTATDLSAAGVLVDNHTVLTCARGLTARERVGVALPLRTHERAAYRDPLALHLAGAWRAGSVVARDAGRDLAVIRLDAPCDGPPLTLAADVPKPGDAVHAVSHPGGLEFAWVYAGGAVRQRGRVALDLGDKAPRVPALVLQLPAQTGSPGGPVANAKGELIGILSAREGAQSVGYCADADEVAAFLDVARHDRPPKTLAGLLARLEARPSEWASALARGLAARAATGGEGAARDCDAALSLDPGCVAARLVRAKLRPENALGELDSAVEKGGFHRDALLQRAALASAAKDFRKARGDLERVLAVFPADADARQQLAAAHLGLGDDAKAATALADTLRADPKRLASVASDLLTQADALEQKFAGSPGVAADWLQKALTAVEPHTATKAIAETLKAARGAKTDAERLRVLRAGVKGLR